MYSWERSGERALGGVDWLSRDLLSLPLQMKTSVGETDEMELQTGQMSRQNGDEESAVSAAEGIFG